MRYIDANKLLAEIEQKISICEKQRSDAIEIECYNLADYASARIGELRVIQETIASLQQEQPVGEEYAIEIGKGVHTLRVGSQSDIDHLIHQEKQEQPKVDLEEFDKEVTKLWGRCAAEPNDSIACLHIETFNEIARHFYELGLNARKEDAK